MRRVSTPIPQASDRTVSDLIHALSRADRSLTSVILPVQIVADVIAKLSPPPSGKVTVTDEMVRAACEAYVLAFTWDEHKTKMRAALEAALSE